jgi:hypothetical protein
MAPLRYEPGFTDGDIEIRFYRDGSLIKSEIIEIGWRPSVYSLSICEGVNRQSLPWTGSNCGQEFQYGLTEIYPLFDVVNFNEGQPFGIIWLLNGETHLASSETWDQSDTLGQFTTRLSNKDNSPLAVGEHEFGVVINGELEKATRFTITQ